MTAYYADEQVTVLQGACLDVLRTLPDGSVHCCVTSPPYWGLRDYGTAEWEGGDPECDHVARKKPPTVGSSSGLGYPADGGPRRIAEGNAYHEAYTEQYRDTCGKCGATRKDQQMGLESTPEEYVAGMVEVFRGVRRVLRDDGTLWLNLGDSYVANAAGANRAHGFNRLCGRSTGSDAPANAVNAIGGRAAGLKPKDLVGIPWRVAFALQADGWVLRSDIVWAKVNPMPESVKDRPTKAHEMVFLFSKAKWRGPKPGLFAHVSDEDARWLALLFDTEGNIVIKRAKRDDGRTQYGAQMAFANTSRALLERAQAIVGEGSILKRPGTNAPVFYWQLSGRKARHLLHRIYPYLIVKARQAAVAIHMQDEVRRPKKRPGGCRTPEHEEFLDRCWKAVKDLNRFGDPDLSWVPEVKYGRWDSQPYFYDADAIAEEAAYPDGMNGKGPVKSPFGQGFAAGRSNGATGGTRNRRTVWEITTKPYPEAHFATFPPELPRLCIKAGCPEGGTVLDPFAGAGTTAWVAKEHFRKSIAIELNPEYCALIAKRCAQGVLPLDAA